MFWQFLARVISWKSRTFAVRFGERLRIPVDWSVNSGAFGRTQRFVNRQPEMPGGPDGLEGSAR